MIVTDVPVRTGDCWLIPGDIHFDKQDDDALEIMLQVAEAQQVNGCILIGDTFDSAGISRHGRPARNFRDGKGTIAAERAAALPILRTIVGIVKSNRRAAHQPTGGLHCLTGNHCAWWDAVQDDYPGFLDTQWWELYGDLFDHWHMHGESTALKLGRLLVTHGHRLRGSLSKHSASAVLANYPGQNTLYGHTHRVDSCITPTYKYGQPVDHGAWTIGHMRDIHVELQDRFLGPHAERHKQGFALVHFMNVQGDVVFDVEQVLIRRTPDGRPYAMRGTTLYGPY